MRSEVTRGGESLRPSINWARLEGNNISPAQATGEVTESLRNLSESYFADFLFALQETVRVLKRIDRRLAKHAPLK